MMNETAPIGGRPQRVAYVLKRFPRLSETFVLNEILELERQGVEVEIFSLLKPPEEPRHEMLAGVRAPVTYLPRGRALETWRVQTDAEDAAVADLLDEGRLPFPELLQGKAPGDAAQICLKAMTLAMLAASRQVDHMHAHFGTDATTTALLASRLSGIPFSYTAHARDIYHTYLGREADDAIRRRKIAEAAAVVTVSDYNRAYLSRLAAPGTADHIHRIYNGINLDRFAYKADDRAVDVFVCVGRLIEKKGFRHLVEACRLLLDSGRKFRCVIVGEGPEREALEAQIRESGLEEHISLIGPRRQEDLLGLMTMGTAMVLPCVVSESGDRDGLPTVLLEALAVGLPAISTTVAGIPEIITDGQTGLLVPPADPPRLAEAMGTLLDQPDLRQRLAEAGRRKAEWDFDLRVSVAALKRLFTGCGAGRKDEGYEGRDENRLRYG